MKRFISLLFAIFLAGCSSATSSLTAAPAVEEPTSAPTETPTEAPTVEPEARSLTVFAAASLTDAFTEIGANFDAANPGVSTTFNFAGSQALRIQIQEGAPADVFASANNIEMNALVDGSFVMQGVPQVFLKNQLVVVLPTDNPAGIDSLEGLATSGVKIVLAAEEVPVGRYTREALEKMNAQFGSDFSQTVLANVVSNEDNVRQVLTKVQLGEADAGIVYTSDAVGAPELQTIEISTDLNVIAFYPIAPLSASRNAELAEAFIAYVLSSDGQAVLQKWGFGPAE